MTDYSAEIRNGYVKLQDFCLKGIGARNPGCQSFDSSAGAITITTNTNGGGMNYADNDRLNNAVLLLTEALRQNAIRFNIMDQSNEGSQGGNRPKIVFTMPNTYASVEKLQAAFESAAITKITSLLRPTMKEIDCLFIDESAEPIVNSTVQRELIQTVFDQLVKGKGKEASVRR